jgi:hypothetical protein
MDCALPTVVPISGPPRIFVIKADDAARTAQHGTNGRLYGDDDDGPEHGTARRQKTNQHTRYASNT